MPRVASDDNNTNGSSDNANDNVTRTAHLCPAERGLEDFTEAALADLALDLNVFIFHENIFQDQVLLHFFDELAKKISENKCSANDNL